MLTLPSIQEIQQKLVNAARLFLVGQVAAPHSDSNGH